MKVSVVVTCYNYAAYVEEAIDSVLAQETPADEIIVIDDGSTDESARILESRYGDHERVRIIRTTNRGQLAAFQAGVAASSGDLVAFLDADDRWRATYLTTVARKFTNAPETDIAITQVRSFGGLEGRLWRKETRDRRIGYEMIRTAFRWHWNGVPTSGVAMRISLAQRLVDVPEDMLPQWIVRADDILIFGAALLGACKHVIAESLVDYRVHESNHWHARKLNYLKHCRYSYCHHRMLQHFAKAHDINYGILRHAHLEFKTIERPTWKEFREYAALCRQAPLPWRLILRRWLLMTAYWGRERRASFRKRYH